MSETMIFAKPAPGVSLPLPDGAPWPAAGARVLLDRYVRRRLQDGDLVECDPPLPPSSSPGRREAPRPGGPSSADEKMDGRVKPGHDEAESAEAKSKKP